MAEAHQTLLEIDLTALGQNYHYLRSKLSSNTKMLGVVKAFGYGSSDVAVAAELDSLGIDYLAVAYASEGVRLRDAGIETPVLVLHSLPANFDAITKRCLEPNIYSRKLLSEFIAYAKKEGLSQYPIHLKFNTGLNRLGFSEDDISFILKALSETESVTVRSVLSHLAASEDMAEAEFTHGQIGKFQHITETLVAQLGYTPMMHTVNTSGLLNYPEAHFDMVRTGIGLYGFGNDPEYSQHLRPIVTVKTVISQIHEIQPGESVGYNRAYTSSETMRTATLPIGHADGISRAYGNGKGWVTIAGKKAPIVGNVCMDMIMVDVTHISCEEGDEVIVFGSDPTAEQLAESIDSISYELITALSRRIKQVVCRK